jgi:histone demethylase JARID1
LYRLKKTVERKGGFDVVCKAKRWAEVGRDLGYSGKIMSSLSTSLKNSYQKWLLPYEEYLRVAKPGVQHHLEMMNGGPLTPSPAPSPVKKFPPGTPLEIKQENPAIQASNALNATIDSRSPPLPPLPQDASRPASTGGFTPVNIGGGFTAVNAQSPTPGFTSVNGQSGTSHPNVGAPATPMQMTPTTNGHGSAGPPSNGMAAFKRQYGDLTPDDTDASGRRSKRLKRDTPVIAGSNMLHSRMGASRPQASRERSDHAPGDICEGCGKSENTNKQLICEECEQSWHPYCLDPPVKEPPTHGWICPRCLVGNNEYGFEEGDVYSLAGFLRKATEFKQDHFANLPRQYSPFNGQKNVLTENDVEREFWRLVDDHNDAVEVEYGADIHSTTHGSGFPTIEKQPRDPYSHDPWNLNIWPLDKESLFRHVKSDVSGMTIPWLYVGMVFSTFCWHNEDHFAYSVNYQHLGETKTWYGIPGEDAEKFEAAMRAEMPELFENQPDILFQLVTLAKPEKLREAGVNVYAIDQHAGQFVVTFPKAYHAGFNHGFNVNEAVNFAPADWEPFGEEGVQRLRSYRKQPCFSHDEMLLTAASGSYSITTAKWLGSALERMRDTEMHARTFFREPEATDTTSTAVQPYSGPRYQKTAETIDPETEEEEIICTFCKCYCYLSRVVCTKTNKTMCLLHAGQFECCDALESERYSGQNGEHVLLYRMSDAKLDATVRKVVDKANIPENWAAKVDSELDDNPRPSLKHLRTLLTEGEKIQYDLPQLADLRRFVERCNEWVEEATSYITRKQQKRKSEKVWRKGKSQAAEQEEREKELRNVDNIHRLLARADEIAFDCQEINTLRERSDNIKEFRRNATHALENIRSHTTVEFEELVERGKEFHVDIPEIDQLESLLKRLRWDDLARAKRPNPDTMRQDQTLSDISKFIQAGLEIGVPDSNPDIVFFREHIAQGELWEQKASELMAVEHVHYQQLDALSRQAITLPVSAETLARVDNILRKQREVQEKIVSLYERTKEPDLRNRPYYREVRDVMQSLEELQSKPAGTIDLEKEQKRHEDWMRRGKKLFGKANAPLHILGQHMEIVNDRNVACFDLADTPRGPVEPSSRANSPNAEGMDRSTDGSNSSRDVFCVCRRPEAGMMIECELCHEWYHGKCLKIARGKVKEDDKYTCPICDWRVKIPRDAARPKLEDLQSWYEEMPNLPFQPEEEATLTSLCDAGQAFRDFLRPYINPIVTSSEEVGTLRFHLRKVEGADILLAYETNYLRQELHKWAPVAPEPPPLIEASSSTRKPRPTKQQKIMAQLGITNPEDLPQQYKIKPHIARRKASEAFGKNQLPLQPAGTASSSPAPHPLGPQTLGTFQAAPKPGLTALAIQVLGNLASIPVAQKMLAAEPHMNREKLDKMRRLLSDDPNAPDDVEAFTARMSTLPHMPAFGYDINHKPSPVGSSGPGSAFREQSMFSNAGASPTGANGASPTLQHPHLASPANFSPAPHFAGRGSPPSPNFGTVNMFDSPDAHTNGAVEFKPTVTTPGEYPSVSRGMMGMGMGMGMGMFESPRTSGANASGLASLAQASLQSPGYGGSQHSVGGLGINDVFADLVDHDAAGLDSATEGKDKDVEAGVRPSTESNGDFSAMSNMDPQLGHKVDHHDAHLLDSGFVATTEVSPGPQIGSITQQSPAATALPESFIDPGLNGTHDVAHE